MKKIGLKEAIEALRMELSESILTGEGKEVRFEVGQIEMEFQVTIEASEEVKGGIKFWVVELGGSSTDKNSTVHKVKIPLKPMWKDGSPVLTCSEEIPD